MTMATKQEIFNERLKEYLAASKEDKGRVLDAVCNVTGGNRKAAIRRFKTLQNDPHLGKSVAGGRRPLCLNDGVRVTIKISTSLFFADKECVYNRGRKSENNGNHARKSKIGVVA